MLESLTSVTTVGLFFSGQRLKMCQLAIEKGIPKITRFETFEIESPDDVKRLDIPSDRAVVASSLPALDVLVRQLQIKLTKKKDVDAVLAFQAEPLIPFPIEESSLESIELFQSKSGTTLTILAVRHELVQQHLERLETLGIDPEVVSTSPAALATFSDAVSSSQKGQPTLILHFGMEETLCVMAVDGKLLAEHTIPLGLSEAIRAAGEDTGGRIDVDDIGFSEEHLNSAPSLRQFVTKLKQEVGRAIFSLVKQYKGDRIAKVLLTGQGASLKGIEAVFTEGLHVEVTRPAPQFGQSGKVIQEYAIPIGLALASLNGEEPAVNFRRGRFAYKDRWKRSKYPLIAYFALSFLTAGALYFAGHAWIQSQLDQAKTDYSRLLKTIEQPYTPFEREYSERNRLEEPTDLKEMTADQLFGRLELAEEKISRAPSPYELLPNVPRVSDVLGWLASHPLVTDPESGSPLLNIKNFQYSMVKRPDVKKRNEKYRVKVDIEFTTNTPKLAREFHDALIAPNELVDPKGEVKWNTSRDVYRTSFYLKNRAPKPAKRSQEA